MYLLDTNVVSELRKQSSGRIDGNVLAWSKRIDPRELFISAITVHELEVGILQKQRKDSVQGALFRSWMDDIVLPSFVDRILPIDSAVSLQAASLQIPDRRPLQDALIAATALVHNMVVVTRNVSDFARTGARLLNPWEPQA